MERYNTIVKIEEIKRLTENGEIERAVRAADTVEYERLRTVSDLGVLAEAYIRGKEFGKARRIYEKIFERSRSRRVAMQLVNLSIKLKDIEAAEEYLEEFTKIAPDDFYRYIFRYSIDKLKGEPYEVLIDSLEKLKKKEYIEKWAYELAKLYHKAGMDRKCVDECSDIILWFGEGQYVDRAKALRSYYYGELDLGWLEESRLMETQPIPPLNLALPKEPVPFVKPAPAQPKKDERFERKMTGGYVSPIDGSRTKGAGIPASRPASLNAQRPAAGGYSGKNPEEEPLPVIDVEGLFDLPKQEPSESGESKAAQPSVVSFTKKESAAKDRRIAEDKSYAEKGNPPEEESAAESGRIPEDKSSTEEENLLKNGNAAEDKRIPEDISHAEIENLPEEESAAGKENLPEDESPVKGGSLPESESPAESGQQEAAARESRDSDEKEWGRESLTEELLKQERREEREKTPVQQPAGQIRTAQEPASAQLAMFRESLADQELRYESLFGLHSRIPGMEEQLARTLSDTVTGEAVQYNYRIVGEKSTGKTALAKNISRYLYRTGCIATPRVALITAGKLNHINLIQKKEAIADCCMIIEEAGKLNTSAAAGLAHVIRTFNGRIAVILEDTKENMDRLAAEREPLIRLFKPDIVLPGYTPEGLAPIVTELLKEKDYHLLPGAEEALLDCLKRHREQAPEEFNLQLADRLASMAAAKADQRNEAELLKFAESGSLGKADLEGVAAKDFEEI